MLSVVIPTFNCEKKLDKCLASVAWADEIIVVDMMSTDKTVSVAKKYNANIFKRVPADGNFDSNRRFGMLQAKGDWIMKLDSDEELTDDLQDEIKTFLKNDKGDFNGIYFYNKIFMFNKEVKHGFVKRGSNELRMFRNGTWKYEPYRFHQQITVVGRTFFSKNYYHHYNFDSVGEFINKMNNYTSLDAIYISKERRYSSIKIALSPFFTFIKLFIFQKGFLDGLFGVQVSMLFAMYYFVEKIKVWEIQNK